MSGGQVEWGRAPARSYSLGPTAVRPMTDVASLLDEHGFDKPLAVESRTSVADLFKPGKRTGIYVLGFSNGEVYAGKSVDVTRRYHQHRKAHADLASLRFLCVPSRSLDETERDVIWSLEAANAAMRNIALMSEPQAGSDLDFEVMDPDAQQRFLDDLRFNDGTGTRTNDPAVRARYTRRFAEFLGLPEAEPVTQFLRAYVPACIPGWLRSEMTFWSVSCWPSKKDVRTRLNINWQEVLTLYVFEEELRASFHAALSPLEEKYGPTLEGFLEAFPSAQIDDDFYKPGGQDQLHVFAPMEYRVAFDGGRCVSTRYPGDEPAPDAQGAVCLREAPLL